MLDYTLSVGRGNDPGEWQEITPATASAVEDGVLGSWDIEQADEGTYLIRLVVRGSGGESYREFIPLSLERGDFDVHSSPGPPALRPALSGRFVAWQSLRDEGDPPGASSDSNLFANDLVSGRQWALEVGANNAQNPSISFSPAPFRHSRGRRDLVAAWQASTPDSYQTRGYGCRLDPASGLCPAFEIAPGAPFSSRPVAAQGRIFWLAEDGGGLQSLRGCQPDAASQRCAEYDLGLASARRAFLRSDGKTLSWMEHSGGQRVGFCHLDPASGACPAQWLRDSIAPYSRVAVSGNLLAWVQFNFRGNQPLLICEFQPETGACPPLEVSPNVRDSTPQLSGRRLVWDGQVGDEASDVFFCEYDPVLGRCPVQRVTAEMTTQADSDIDGRRLIWQDERLGSSTVFGTTLPRFAPIGRPERRVAPGDTLRMRVRADKSRRRKGKSRDRGVPPIGLEVHKRVGELWRPVTLAELGVRLAARSSGSARVRWRPDLAHAGVYAFTFSARDRSGLVARESMTVTVEAPPVALNRPDEAKARGPWKWLRKRLDRHWGRLGAHKRDRDR